MSSGGYNNLYDMVDFVAMGWKTKRAMDTMDGKEIKRNEWMDSAERFSRFSFVGRIGNDILIHQ